ncbi:hypothetical protein BH18ACI3_BH18ACI3_18130 [soil metagenome]
MNPFSSIGMFQIISKSYLTIAVLVTMATAALAADFDRDGKADFAVFRPSSTTWHCEPSGSDAKAGAFKWGHASDILVPADYDSDGKTDFAMWRPENGVWYIHQSGDDSVLLVRWGMTTMHPTGGLPDVPVAADYDGDGETDLAVWRPDTGEWWIVRSSNGYDQDKAIVFQWGKLGDVPVQGDYDGDKKTDVAIFRPTESRWYIRSSSNGKSSVQPFGIAGLDTLVPGDYTGDKKADIAVYRSGVWHVLNSDTGETEQFHFGFNDDVAVPADYDGDGTTDFAVYRSGTWYLNESSSPRLRSYSFGQSGDVPVNSGVVRQSIVAVP